MKYNEKNKYLSKRSMQKKFWTVVHSILVSNSQHKLGDILFLLAFHLSLWKNGRFSIIFFQDFPGPPALIYRTFQVLEFSRKKPGLSRRRGNPAYLYFTSRIYASTSRDSTQRGYDFTVITVAGVQLYLIVLNINPASVTWLIYTHTIPNHIRVHCSRTSTL